MQRNWIGKSEGCQFAFKGIDCPDVEVFTTRIDTVFGVTYVVVAPDHPQVQSYITEEQKKECQRYIKKTQEESELERTKLDKEKTGVFSGSYVTNPFSDEKVPVWIADYVLGHYGTGAVMAVPAHDERDFAFAKKYGTPLKVSIIPGEENQRQDVLDFLECFTGDGVLVYSGAYDGLTSSEAKKVLTEIAEKEGFGKKVVNYKLRDWIFSRQRYWGEPIPVIHIHDDAMKSIVSLNFRKTNIVDRVLSGEKTIETRALNPDESERYF